MKISEYASDLAKIESGLLTSSDERILPRSAMAGLIARDLESACWSPFARGEARKLAKKAREVQIALTREGN